MDPRGGGFRLVFFFGFVRYHTYHQSLHTQQKHLIKIYKKIPAQERKHRFWSRLSSFLKMQNEKP